MTEPLIIDGWVCRLGADGARVAGNQESVFYPSAVLRANGALTCEGTYIIPPAVLAWLVAPLIERGDAKP